MSVRFSPRLLILTGIAAAAGTIIPATAEFDASHAASLSRPLALQSPESARAAMLTPEATPAQEVASDSAPGADENTALDAETECMAKVVHHEAANQSREGQLAVAQLIVNRLESGHFAGSICGVVNQPGQFFHTASYSPRHDARWDMAVDVAREAIAGVTPDVVPGALFYHAAYQAPPRFFRSRARVMTLGDHVFYR